MSPTNHQNMIRADKLLFLPFGSQHKKVFFSPSDINNQKLKLRQQKPGVIALDLTLVRAPPEQELTLANVATARLYVQKQRRRETDLLNCRHTVNGRSQGLYAVKPPCTKKGAAE